MHPRGSTHVTVCWPFLGLCTDSHTCQACRSLHTAFKTPFGYPVYSNVFVERSFESLHLPLFHLHCNRIATGLVLGDSTEFGDTRVPNASAVYGCTTLTWNDDLSGPLTCQITSLHHS